MPIEGMQHAVVEDSRRPVFRFDIRFGLGYLCVGERLQPVAVIHASQAEPPQAATTNPTGTSSISLINLPK